MNEVKIPSPGRIVHYFPAPGEDDLKGGQPFYAAISVDGTDLAPCLCVFNKSEANPVIFRWSVQHKSAAPDGTAYWEWPEIK